MAGMAGTHRGCRADAFDVSQRLFARQCGLRGLLRSIEDRMVLSRQLAINDRRAVHPGLGLLHPLVQREAHQDVLGRAQSYRLPKKLRPHAITSPRIPPHPPSSCPRTLPRPQRPSPLTNACRCARWRALHWLRFVTRAFGHRPTMPSIWGSSRPHCAPPSSAGPVSGGGALQRPMDAVVLAPQRALVEAALSRLCALTHRKVIRS